MVLNSRRDLAHYLQLSDGGISTSRLCIPPPPPGGVPDYYSPHSGTYIAGMRVLWTRSTVYGHQLGSKCPILNAKY
jgi:hypothetical protein